MQRRPCSLVTSNLQPQRSPTFSSRNLVLRKRCSVGRPPRTRARATGRDKRVRFVHACWPTLRVRSGIIAEHSFWYGQEMSLTCRDYSEQSKWTRIECKSYKIEGGFAVER